MEGCSGGRAEEQDKVSGCRAVVSSLADVQINKTQAMDWSGLDWTEMGKSVLELDCKGESSNPKQNRPGRIRPVQTRIRN